MKITNSQFIGTIQVAEELQERKGLWMQTGRQIARMIYAFSHHKKCTEQSYRLTWLVEHGGAKGQPEDVRPRLGGDVDGYGVTTWTSVCHPQIGKSLLMKKPKRIGT